MLNRWQAPTGRSLRKVHPVICASKRYNIVRHLRRRTNVRHPTSAGYADAPPAVMHSLPSRWHITCHVNHKPGDRVCNRAAVVDGGDVRVSPHSCLRRQCGVIEVVTAPRLISRSVGCASSVAAYRRRAYAIRPYRQRLTPAGCLCAPLFVIEWFFIIFAKTELPD